MVDAFSIVIDELTHNRDGSGYGLNAELGWRILSSAVPAAAGKVLVNRDAADTDFDVCGDTGGSKTHTLTGAEQGKLTIRTTNDDVGSGSGGANAVGSIQINGISLPLSSNGALSASTVISLDSSASAHDIMQPYFTVLTLIKL